MFLKGLNACLKTCLRGGAPSSPFRTSSTGVDSARTARLLLLVCCLVRCLSGDAICTVLKPPDVLASCSMHCLGLKAVLHACWPHMPIDTMLLDYCGCSANELLFAAAALVVLSQGLFELVKPCSCIRLTPPQLGPDRIHDASAATGMFDMRQLQAW